ncbi:MAG: type II toxin-antitoxin system VapC family toxin [Thermodesulfobacteriota bacterium]|nr:type II toxin-antitoxin system VapC family toxin [Thermodesulfobacteriota bacterium]
MPLKYIIDTNIWLWMVEDHNCIPEKIAPIISNAENYPFYLSAISIWEVAKKVSLGKLTLSIPIRDWLTKASRKPFIEIVPLSLDISLESTVLPGSFHKDPADQIIVASARQHNMVLLTADQKIIAYPHVRTI